MDKNKWKEHSEKCPAFAALALFNQEQQTDYWTIERPTEQNQCYDFDVRDASNVRVAAIEVKRIVEPTLDRESALGKIVDELSKRLSGRLPGEFQILSVSIGQIPVQRGQKKRLVADLEQEIIREATSLPTGQGTWLDEPIEFILRKVSEKGSTIQPLFGFTAGSGSLHREFYLEIVRAGIKKANDQLKVAHVKDRLLVFDSRTPVSQALGIQLLIDALSTLPRQDWEVISKVFLVEWPSDTQHHVAGVQVLAFPF